MSMSSKAQIAANHARYVPGFHFVTGTVVLLNLAWSLKTVVTGPSASAVQALVVSVVLLALFRYLRTFPLSVQDRLIRLEEQLRLERVLPTDLRSRSSELTADQLIALRFASDAELPELVTRVMSERITTRRDIKGLVRQWRPDHMRA